MFDLNTSRYRFYREHKFISFQFSECERLIAKSDFTQKSVVENIKKQLALITEIMNGHATFEENEIHELLRQKGSTVHESIEAEHQHHHMQYAEFKNQLDEILASTDAQEQEHLGYEFYLNFRLFVSDNLRHLHQEETIIMPELQRLYSDKELRLVEFNTFNQMTPEDMAHMISVLDPHLNPNDRAFFLKEMRDAEPEKFARSKLAVPSN